MCLKSLNFSKNVFSSVQLLLKRGSIVDDSIFLIIQMIRSNDWEKSLVKMQNLQ